jgi:hypothetical protein
MSKDGQRGVECPELFQPPFHLHPALAGAIASIRLHLMGTTQRRLGAGVLTSRTVDLFPHFAGRLDFLVDACGSLPRYLISTLTFFATTIRKRFREGPHLDCASGDCLAFRGRLHRAHARGHTRFGGLAFCHGASKRLFSCGQVMLATPHTLCGRLDRAFVRESIDGPVYHLALFIATARLYAAAGSAELCFRLGQFVLGPGERGERGIASSPGGFLRGLRSREPLPGDLKLVVPMGDGFHCRLARFHCRFRGFPRTAQRFIEAFARFAHITVQMLDGKSVFLSAIERHRCLHLPAADEFSSLH